MVLVLVLVLMLVVLLYPTTFVLGHAIVLEPSIKDAGMFDGPRGSVVIWQAIIVLRSLRYIESL